MARTIDERVVSASFETSKFEQGTQRMISGLDKLKKSMNIQNAGKGLDQFNASANKVNLSHIASGVDAIKGKLNALRLTAIAVFANITSQAIGSATRFVKAFTIAPISQGLHEYENQIKSVQTILANTKDQGTNIKQVNKVLDELNTYADKTIYNFGQMTKNIGTFTAAGVDLKTSVSSIKGISNLAALSGSSAQQASTAMYQLSQAIASGRVSLQDWNSVVNAGMGGAVFQKSLMRTAESMGALKKGAVEIDKATGKATINGKSFRESIMAKPGEQSWLTSDVLTNTLKQFSGDLSKAQLKAQGFNDAQIKAIQSQAKTALNAATKIKTFSQLMDTTKEAVGSGWAQTWRIVLGDFGEAKKLFTALGGAIGGFVQQSAKARNDVLQDWKDLGGRTLLIKSLKEAFGALKEIVTPVKDAFRDIFPRKTGADLFRFTKAFAEFAKSLKPSPETVENLRRTFRGFFAILSIGKQIVGGIFSVIGKLFGAVGSGAGSFLELTAKIGDFLVSVDKALKEGGKLNNFFETIGEFIAAPVKALVAFGEAIGSAFSAESIGKAGQALSPLEKIIEAIVLAWDKFLGSVGSTREVIRPALEGLSEMFGSFGEIMADAIKGMDFDAVFKVIEVSLLGGIFLVLKNSFTGGGLGNALSGGIFSTLVQAFTGVGGASRAIGGTFQALTGHLQAMQAEVKSKALRNIAISIALLAASIVALSFVDPKRLNSALTAITIGFGQLLGAMAILDKIGASTGFAKTPIIAASMVILAVAINLLAIAVYALSRLSWEELAKGLGAVAVLLGSISLAAGPLSANASGMIRAATGITIIAVAMNILAKAVKTFGDMDMSTLAKGIGGIAVALAGIGAAANLFPSGMVALGVGLIAIGAGLKLIVGTVQTLGNMDMSTLGKGIGAIAVALGAIGLAMRLMPGPSMVLTAAGLVLVGLALKSIAKAIGMMGSMSIEEIAKGLGTLAASLSLLALGLYAMSGTLGGAAALVVAAAGIALLAPALKSLGDQSWGQIIKGLVALGAAFVLLGVAGVVLAPVAPAILALGVALIAVGAGLALAGAGVALIGIGLSAVAVAGPAAVKILVDALVQLAEAIPKIIKSLVKALVSLVEGVADAAPKFVKAIGKILVMMAQAIVVAAPQLEKAFIAIIDLILSVLRKETPNLIRTGFEMLKALLKGIIKNIGGVVKMVGTIIAKILGGVASSLGKIISAGASILVALLRGIANNITKVAAAATSIITSFLRGIANNIKKVAKAGVDVITSWLNAIADAAPRIVRAGTNIIVKLIKGIADAGRRIVKAGVDAATKFVNSLAREIPRLVNNVATALIRMLNRLAGVIEKRTPEFIGALANIGSAIVKGIISGMSGLGEAVLDKVKDEIKSLPGKGAKLVTKFFSKVAANTLPDGLGRDFGITFTNEVLEQLHQFDAAFQEKLAKVGGAENIQFLYNLGNDLSRSFRDGLLEGMATLEEDPVDKMNEVRMAITDQLASIRGETQSAILESYNKIKAANAELKRINKALDDANDIKDKKRRERRKKDLNERKKDQKELLGAERDTLEMLEQRLQKLMDTSNFINSDSSYDKEIIRLIEAKDKVKSLNDQLEAQVAILEDLKQKRQSLFEQKFEEFGSIPGIVTEDEHGNPIDVATQVQNYINSLSNADDTVGTFRESLDKLAGMGINKDTYQQLLDIGPAAQGFVNELLRLGPETIKAINAADNDLKNAARILADHGAGYMYDAGIKDAEGFINGLGDGINIGLKKQLKNAIKAAEDIATAIIKAVKRKLGMKSPSKVFAEIGAYSVEGMAQGLSKSSGLVVDAIYGVSDDAKAAIKKSMSGISEMVASEINTDPVITPVLDLSQIQAGAKQIGSVLPVASMSLASGISVPGIGDSLSETGQAAPIQFIQNNNSPKSLSSIEIYRQTKNQLSQVRPVLKTP